MPIGKGAGLVKGSVYKRCTCRDPQTARLLGRGCPQLKRANGSWNPRHGAWHIQCDLPRRADGTRRTLRHAGYPTQDDATADLLHLNTLLAIPDRSDTTSQIGLGDLIKHTISTDGRLPDTDTVRRALQTGTRLIGQPTVAEWLDQWLAGKRNLADSTRSKYAEHIRRHLIPHLGHLRLDRLRRQHIAAMIEAIIDRADYVQAIRESGDKAACLALRGEKVTGATTLHRIRATLRAALNAAIREDLIAANPATHIELPSPRRPRPLVWTPERVRRWEADGTVPGPVMVWTAEQTGRFLDAILDDALYPLFHLVAYRGLRRGEACGLHDDDLDLTAGEITIRWQLLGEHKTPTLARTKTESSDATIALDDDTITVLRRHRAAQAKQRLAAREPWPTHGLLFTTPDGQPLQPGWVTAHFQRLIARAGLPPIRLHDLRHGAATLALAAGVDLKVVQAMLRHSTITLTADTYSSVLPQLAKDAANATAATIPRAQHHRPQHHGPTPPAL
ncbi:site-specific integrase [Actinocatenispora comari]|uniref:Site-specific integrase n=1 Tax=Actinocatenispora comari TaxID=2807577 RepID=A0A8J4AE18_9ACTN|nr:site-specific integrase [Actinocatenispora comari]